MITERALMRRVAEGDAQAFTELVSRYSARLLTFAWRLLGNRADAEDAVQRALMRCYTSATRYRPDWAVSTWLYRITTNICVDELRRRCAGRPRARPATGRPSSFRLGTAGRPVRGGISICGGRSPGYRARPGSCWPCVTWTGCRTRSWRASAASRSTP